MLAQQSDTIKSKLYPLTCMDNWSCWLEQRSDGKTKKLPFNPKSGRLAKSNDSKSWVPFSMAANVAILNPHRFPGISFALGEKESKSGIVGIDIDDCLHSGVVDCAAQKIIDYVNSYTEYSPSGNGVHIFVIGKLPGPSRRTRNIEFYDWGRFLTVTGNLMCGNLAEVDLSEIYYDLFPRIQTIEKALPVPLYLDDEGLIERVMKSRASSKFFRIWHGDYTGYKSSSEAWFAICSILAFWTQDPEQINRIVASRTRDPKWWEKRGQSTYGILTATRAIATKSNFYGKDGNGVQH